MNVTPTAAPNAAPNAARGEVLLTIAGEQFPVRFGMNVMRDFTRLTGRAPSEFPTLLAEDYNEALTGLLTCAVRRYVPSAGSVAVGVSGFSQDDAGDLIDAMSQEEADAVAEALMEAVSVGPLMAALLAKVTAKNQAAPTLPVSGTNTSTSPLAS